MKVFFLIKSCRKNRDRRDVCRETWLHELSWADYGFVVGRDATPGPLTESERLRVDEPDVFSFDLKDDFPNIARKLAAALDLVIRDSEKKYTHVFVVDDDTYVLTPRLVDFLLDLDRTEEKYVHCFERKYVDEYTTGKVSQHYPQGSAYLLPRFAADRIVRSSEMRDGVPDDVAVGNALSNTDVQYRHSDRFWPGPTFSEAPRNAITLHKCSPDDMRSLHERLWG